MCVIINLPAGVHFPKDALFNAVYNNPHAYGLVIKNTKTGRLSMTKGAPAEVDPEMIHKLLEDNIKQQRILHLRWATRGGKTEENAQPFLVYDDKKGHQIYFFHNGTLTGFGSTSYANGQDVGVSDTNDFANKILAPALNHWQNADYGTEQLSPFFNVVIKPSWTAASKGLLVSTKMPDLKFGPDNGGWTKFEIIGAEAGQEVWVSNDEYFKDVTRGPEKERREAAARKAKEEEARQSGGSFRHSQTTSSGKSIPSVVDWCLDNLGVDDAVLDSLAKLFPGNQLVAAEDLAKLAFVSREEFTRHVSDACAENCEDMVAELLIRLSQALHWSMLKSAALEKNLGRKQNKINELLGMTIEAKDKATEEVPIPAVPDAIEEDDDDMYHPSALAYQHMGGH